MNSDWSLFNPDKRSLFNSYNRGLLHSYNRGLFNPNQRSLLHPDNGPPPLLKPHHVRPWCLWHVNYCRSCMLDRRTPVDDWGSVNQARVLGLDHRCWRVLMLHHQRGLLDRFDLHLVVVLLYVVVKIQFHYMRPGGLRCHRCIYHGRFWHSKPWWHHHPWSLVHQPASLLVNHLMQVGVKDLPIFFTWTLCGLNAGAGCW